MPATVTQPTPAERRSLGALCLDAGRHELLLGARYLDGANSVAHHAVLNALVLLDDARSALADVETADHS